MEVSIELGDPIIVTVSGVHPVALADAICHAVDAALRLNRELRLADTSDTLTPSDLGELHPRPRGDL